MLIIKNLGTGGFHHHQDEIGFPHRGPGRLHHRLLEEILGLHQARRIQENNLMVFPVQDTQYPVTGRLGLG